MPESITNTVLLFWGRKGGGAKYSLELARELSRRKDTSLALSLSRQCEIYDQFETLSLPVFNVHTVTSLSGFLFRWIAGRSGLSRRFGSWLKQNQTDLIIIGMDFFWGPVIYQAARRTGVKTILVVHEAKPHPGESLPIALLKRMMLGKTIRGADHVVSLTEHVKRYISDRYGVSSSRISVIPHGVFSFYQADKPRQLDRDRPVSILFFGRIEHYKGLDILIDAVRLIEMQSGSPEVTLHICGSGDLSPYQEALSQLRDVRIKNHWLTEPEIANVFETVDISVLPYREASQSGVVGIACSAALPIVACPCDGLAEQLEDCGAVLSDDISADSLAASLMNTMTDSALYRDLSENSLMYAQSLGWDTIASSFQEIGKELVMNESGFTNHLAGRDTDKVTTHSHGRRDDRPQ